MAEIDSLEIKIESDAAKASAALDKLAGKISDISNKILGITSSDQGIQNLTKSFSDANPELTKLSKKTSEIVKQYQNLGKNFKFFGSSDAIEKQIQRYSNLFETAKLKQKELELSGKTQGKAFESAVRDVQKYKNILASLKKQLKSVADTQVYDDEWLKSLPSQAEKMARKVKSGRKKKDAEPMETTSASSNLYNKDAMRDVFGPAYAEVENFQQALAKAGARTNGEFAKITSGALETATEKLAKFGEKLKLLQAPRIEVSDLKNLQSMLEKSEQKLADLRAKLKNGLSMGNITESVDDPQYTKLREQIALEEKTLDSLRNKYARLREEQMEEAEASKQAISQAAAAFEENLRKLQVPEIREDNLDKLEAALDRAENKLEELRVKMENGLSLGEIDATVTDKTFTSLLKQMALTEKQADAIRSKIESLGDQDEGIQEFRTQSRDIGAFENAVKRLQKAFAPLHKMLQKANSLINSFAKKIASVVSPMKKASKATDGFGKSVSLNFKTILKYGFGIRSLFVLFNRLRGAITDGMTNLIQYSAATNQSLSMLKSSLNQTKNSLAAAFSPILNAIAPAVNYLIQLLTKAINVVNQFFAAITGNSSWIRAKYVYEDVAAGISGVGSSAEDTAKKIKGSLQSFDALNNLTTQESADAGGGGGSILPEDMFETLPINDKIKEFADKVKDILKRLFEPLKKAWDREGKFVMDSWKKALNNVWALIKDIGRDFLRVWEQPATVDVLANILHIIGDIGLVVANLAEQFREAWNENEVGFHILEKIRDIIGIIVQHIRNAADATVEWSAQLDFYPLLDAVDRFLESIKPVVDAVYGVMEDFYTQVLLPLGQWTLEKGLPELLQVFIDFNNEVDWEALRGKLSDFWDHLEPFAETVGEGLIIFIDRVSDALADFLNSEEFENFLQTVEDWMDDVTPEDVADALENVAKAVVGIKTALTAWPAIEGFLGFVAGVGKLVVQARQAKKIKELADAMKSLSAAGGAAEAAGGGAAAAGAAGLGIGQIIFGVGAGAAVGGLVGKWLDNNILAPLNQFDEELYAQYKNFKFFGENGFFSTLFSSIEDGSGKEALKMLANDYKEILTSFTDGSWKDALKGLFHIDDIGSINTLDNAMKKVADGAIYTDAQMRNLQATWKLSADDMEMLRQSMLDTHPELRQVADSFDFLSTASVESLEQIRQGLQYVDNGVSTTDEIARRLARRYGEELTPTAKNFFDAMFSGSGSLEDNFQALQNGEQVIDGYVSSLDTASTSMQNLSTEAQTVSETISSSLGNLDSNILSNSITTALGIAKEVAYPDAQEAGEYLSGGIAEGMSLADLSAPAQTAFDSVLTAFNIAAGINSPAENMKPSGQNLMLGIVEGFKSKIESFGAPISQLITSITTKFTGAIGTVKNAWTSIWSGLPSIMVNIFNSISSSLSSFISSIGNKLSGLASSVRNKFGNIGSGTFGGLSSNMTRAISNPIYSLPKQELQWYGNGAMFTGPTIAGIGEAGTEVAMPLTNPRVMSKISESILDNYNKDSAAGNNSAQEILLLQEQNQLLTRQNELLTNLASKEFGITEDQIGQAAQNWAFSFQKRTGDAAYSF